MVQDGATYNGGLTGRLRLRLAKLSRSTAITELIVTRAVSAIAELLVMEYGCMCGGH